MLECKCEENINLPTLDPSECFKHFGKDAKWAFQILDDANNQFVNGVNGIEEESSWTGLALDTNTNPDKITVTPFLEDVNFASPDKLEDSENIDGAPNYVGKGPQLVTAMIRNVTPDQFDALERLECFENLTLYRIDNNGNIMARKTADAPATHAGLKISPRTFSAKDPEKGGTRADQMKVAIEFYMRPGWYKTSDVVTPEATFDPLTEIKP